MERQDKDYIQANKKLYRKALVMGILSITIGLIPFIGLIVSIIALVIAIKANKKVKIENDDDTCVMTGLVMSIVGVSLGVAIIIGLLLSIYVYNFIMNVQILKDPYSYSSYDIDPEGKLESWFKENFKRYDGETLDSFQVMSLIDDVIAANEKYVDQDSRFITIDIVGLDRFDEKNLVKACEKAEKNNNLENVNEATFEMRELKSYINSYKKYRIEVFYNDNKLVNKIVIYGIKE